MNLKAKITARDMDNHYINAENSIQNCFKCVFLTLIYIK